MERLKDPMVSDFFFLFRPGGLIVLILQIDLTEVVGTIVCGIPPIIDDFYISSFWDVDILIVFCTHSLLCSRYEKSISI